MKQNEKIAALKRTTLFGELDDATLCELARHTTVRRLSKDEVLFLAGEPAKGLYVVVSGSIRAMRRNAEGREQIIHTETAGFTFAEVPVFDGGDYPATVAAEEPSTILFLEAERIRQLCFERPQIALTALKIFAKRLRHHAEMVESLSLRNVEQRLARWLLREVRSGGTHSDKLPTLKLTLTNQQIAARIGTVREVASRAFARLQDQGLIRIQGRTVTILQEAELETYFDD